MSLDDKWQSLQNIIKNPTPLIGVIDHMIQLHSRYYEINRSLP